MPLHHHAKCPKHHHTHRHMPPVCNVAASLVLRQPTLKRKRDRRTADEKKERHDDIPKREPLPRMGELEEHTIRQRASTICCPIVGITERGSTHTPSPASSLIRRAIEIIDAEAANGISPDSIARRLNISRRLLDLRFHQYESTTITEMIASRRIDTAKRLLASPHISIKDVFRKAGFGNTSYATRLFRKCTGLSPHDWRKLKTEHHANIQDSKRISP